MLLADSFEGIEGSMPAFRQQSATVLDSTAFQAY